MDNPDISLLFYRYLCEIIGTEDVVNARRQIYTALDNVYSDRGDSLISSGSKAEGLDIQGSDVDIMLIDNDRLVYQNYDQVELDKCCFLMDTSDCKPGFTKLKIPIPHECVLNKYCEYKTGKTYLSSEMYKEKAKFAINAITHGPCKSSPDGEYDVVVGFKCNNWVSQAKSWLLRSRHQWASKNVIDAIVDFGVLLVPIGCKNSPNSDIEWRISFSFAEKLLIWSFNHVQLMCYALLKILFKEVIKHFTGDILCSYFLKTVVFWVCEETESYKWEERKVLSCFMSCIDRLIYCVQYETLVHFFISDNDLFEKRFNSQQQRILLSTLIQLQNLGWTCLLQTRTFQSFKGFMNPTLYTVLPCNCPFMCFLMNFERLLIDLFNSNMTSAVYSCLRSSKMLFQISILSTINQFLGQEPSKGEIRYKGNKQSYNIYRERLCNLLIGSNTDMISGWLLLASFFYVNKQYHVCRMILSDCLVRCISDRYQVIDRSPQDMQTRIEFFLRPYKSKPNIFFTKYLFRVVLFSRHSHILPEELYSITYGKCFLVSPASFGLFLKFLCCHHLCDQREKVKCLHELQICARDGCCMNNDQQSEIADIFLSIANSLLDDQNLYTFYDS